MSQKDKAQEDKKLYDTIINCLNNPLRKQKLDQERLKKFEDFAKLYEETQQQQEEANLQKLDDQINIQEQKLRSKSNNKKQQTYNVQKRSGSVINSKEQKQPQPTNTSPKQQVSRQQNYNHLKPEYKPNLIYQKKTFRFKNQLSYGPQYACIYNKSWNSNVNCKMYINLGNLDLKSLENNDELLQQRVKEGYATIISEHCEKEKEAQLVQHGKKNKNVPKLFVEQQNQHQKPIQLQKPSPQQQLSENANNLNEDIDSKSQELSINENNDLFKPNKNNFMFEEKQEEVTTTNKMSQLSIDKGVKRHINDLIYTEEELEEKKEKQKVKAQNQKKINRRQGKIKN